MLCSVVDCAGIVSYDGYYYCISSRSNFHVAISHLKGYIAEVCTFVFEVCCRQAHIGLSYSCTLCFCISAEAKVVLRIQYIADFRYFIAGYHMLCSVVDLAVMVSLDSYYHFIRYRLDAQLTVLSPRHNILFSFINGSYCSFSKCCQILASVCSLCTHLDSREICSLRCSGKSAYALLMPIIDLCIAVCCQSYVLIVIECKRFILRIYYHFLAARIHRRISLNCNWTFRYRFVIRLIRNNLILCYFFRCAVPIIMNRILIIVPDLPDCIKHILCFIRMNDHIRTCCIFCSCCLRVCAPSDKLITGTGKDCTFCFYLLVILKSEYHYFCFTITGCSTVSVIGQ